MKKATRENQKTLEELRDRIDQLLNSILEPVNSQSRNMPPALKKNILEFSGSVILNNSFSCPFDVLLDDWKN